MTNQLEAVLYNQAANGWVATDSQDNALATASKAGVAGKAHVITGVFASFSGAVTKLLQVKDGSTVIAEYYIVNAKDIPLINVRATSGNAVSAVLAASGTGGTIGKVNITGFTV